MKVILSRKGFDSSNGYMASPIMPDGTLLSLPIIEKDEDVNLTYKALTYGDITYSKIIQELSNFEKDYSDISCHLDPDIRENTHEYLIDKWKPAFGQRGTAQKILMNSGVERGDLFLFFGWFHKTRTNDNGHYVFNYKMSDDLDFYDANDLHIVYGYLQIGDIISDPEEIKKYYWHPHAAPSHLYSTNNVLYVPTDHLSFMPEKKGFGTLNYDRKRVLTMKDKTRAKWINYKFLSPQRLVYQNKKNSAKDGSLYYASIWQELIFSGDDDLLSWIKQILQD